MDEKLEKELTEEEKEIMPSTNSLENDSFAACVDYVSQKSADESASAGELNSNEKLLLAECWRHLLLGQWECFRALLLTFIEETKDKMGIDSAQILLKIFESPELFCKGSMHMKKPQDIFWLCAQLYKEIYGEDDEVAKNLVLEATFRYFIGDLIDLFPQSYGTLKEIYNLFSQYHESTWIVPLILSDDGILFLKNALKKEPVLGINFLKHLIQAEFSINTNNYVRLLRCYYDSLSQLLAIFEVSVNCFRTCQDDLKEDEQAFRILLQEFELFSSFYCDNVNKKEAVVLKDESVITKFREDVDKLILRIWDVCERGVLDRTGIYFSIMSFQQSALIRRFFYFENESKNRFIQPNLTVSAENVLRLIHDKDGQLNIKELCLYAIVNKVHFLECILLNCVHLICCGEYILTCRFLQDSILCRLKPLVFLLAWSRIKSIPEVASLCELHKLLYLDFTEGTDHYLNSVCEQLVWKGNLLRWSLTKSKNIHKNKDKKIRSAVDILKNLYKLSDLTIIHQCIYLEEVDRQELFTILEGTSLEQKLSNDENELKGLTLQQIRDKMVLRSYYILYDASLVVLNGTKLEQMLMHAASTNFDANYDDIREFYRTYVVDPLRKIKVETDKLQPITYRVEILENLYSLLFLTHSNIAENSFESSSSLDENEENFDDEEIPSDSKDLERKTLRKKLKRKSSREDLNFSSFSFNDVKIKLPFVGFLMNDLIIRDWLDYLKTSLCDTQSAWHHTQKKQELEALENKLQSKLISSVTSETLQKHLTKLLQFVNEALWRFHLVSGDWIPEESGSFPSIDMIKNRKVKVSTPINLYGESSEDEENLAEELNEQLNKKDQIGKLSVRRSQRKKSLQKNPIKFIESKSLVHNMLASHESLLNYCLNENLPLKAQQVIKMAGMENTLKALEVDFAMGYEHILEKLQKVTSTSNLKDQFLDNPTVELENGAGKSVSAWDSIMKAASSARGTLADETVIVDELLAKFQVPFINEVNIFGLKPILIEWLPEQIDWRALVRADLALVGCSSMTAAQNLLQSAYLSFRNSESPKSTRRSKSKDRKCQGIASFIREVLSIQTKLYSEEKFINRNELIGEGIRGLLLQGLRSFSYKSHKKMKDTFTQFNLCASLLFNLLKTEKSLLIGPMENVEFFQKKSSSEISSILNLPSEKLKFIDVHLLYNRLIKSITAIRSQLLEDRISRSEVKSSDVAERGPAYLFTFYEYVSYLNTVLPSLEDETSEIQKGFFSILRNSPASIFEKLLFERDVSPLSLEEIAVRLNADVVRIIIEFCCPFIPVKSPFGFENQNVEFKCNNRTKEWKLVSSNLLNYVEEKCWILAVIIRAMTASTKSYSDSDSSESSQCDCAVLYPVLHRYLDKRWVGDVNYSLEWFALCSYILVDVIKPILQKFIDDECWTEALNFLKRWECQLPMADSNLMSLKDEILIKIASSNDSKSYSCAMQIQDMKKRVVTVKENYLKWPSKIAFCALYSCIDVMNPDDEILQIINQVKVCELISKQITSTGDAEYFWQEVHCLLLTAEAIVLNQLFELKKYDLINECSKLYSFNDESQKVVADSLVLALIHVPIIDQSTLCQALESCVDVSQRFSICFKILEHICEQTVNAFSLLSILEGETFDGIPFDDLKAFIKNKIGVKIYLALQEDERKTYFHLVKYPHILIEQLLIDIKIVTLKCAFEEIREDLKILSDDSILSFNALNDILKIYAGKAVDFRVVQTIAEGNSKTNMETMNFVFPGYVPTKSQWIPDSATSECMICNVERFSMFNRRHHCRKCGKLVCSSCSHKKAIVNGYGDVAVRVCDPCFGNDKGVILNPNVHDQDLLKERSIDNSTIGPPESSSMDNSSLDMTNYFQAKLSINETHNLTVREEFSYEQAPNIPLYLLIYDLCWDPHESALDHIKLAKTLLKFLQPISPGQSNQEVDYNLIINMAKSVLLNAKVKFSKTFDNKGVMSADHYLGLTDLFKLLVSANCKHLIPLGDLNQRETIRKLCDVLIKEERWNLALEVSTKGGFDNLGVWAAWGMVCLRAGFFTAAREKFSRCLKPLNKSSKTTLQNCSLLKQILECLENLNVDNDATVISASLERLKNIRAGNLQSISPVFVDGKPNSKIISECLFYLNTYGNHGMTITFYVNNNDWQAALKYVIDHKTSTATFVEEILTASIKKGVFNNLLDKLSAFDPTLDTWSAYLLASCRFLLNGGFHPILYELQMFLKDYARAAMTCINLYQSGAKNYVDLHDRLPFLKQAIQKLQTYSKVYGGDSSSKKTKEHIFIISDEDLEKYIKRIDLQIEITQFLFERADQWQSVKRESFDSLSTSSLMSTSRTSIEMEISTDKPTVFGNLKARAHLFVMIIMSGHTIEDGFNIAVRLLTVCQLNAISVYSLLVKKLIQNGRMADIVKVIICMKSIGKVDNNFTDKVALTAIPEAIIYGHVGKDFDPLIKHIVVERNKIEAYIMCGKLKSAYLLAVRDEKIESVQRIFDEAERTGQTSVKDLCKKWLIQKQND